MGIKIPAKQKPKCQRITKPGRPLIGNKNEVEVNFPGNQGNAGMQTYFVEWVGQQAQAINAVLTFEARNAQGQVISSDSITFYKFRSVVVVVGGWRQGWTLDPAATNDRGIFLLAWHLYAQDGYDVHPFAEYEQNSAGQRIGSGLAYDETWYAVQERRVEYVTAMGFSYGGGAVYNLTERLVRAAAGQIPGEAITRAFAIPFTAYIDAIVHGSRRLRPGPEPVTQTPSGTIFHVNYYQQIDRRLPFQTGIRGAPVQNSNRNVDVNAQAWGGYIDHVAIDDNLIVLGLERQQNQRNEPGIRGYLLQQASIR